MLYFLRYLRLFFHHLKGVSRCVQGCYYPKDIQEIVYSRKHLQDLATICMLRSLLRGINVEHCVARETALSPTPV
jgi:hypothetical protein